MAFPNSPVDGQTTTVSGVSYVYNSTSNSWKVVRSPVPQFTPTGVTPGSYGNTYISQFTVDSYGRLTSVANTSLTFSSLTQAVSNYNTILLISQGALSQVQSACTTSTNALTLSQAAFNRANTTGIGSAGIKYSAGTTPPASANLGDQWYDTTSDILYEYLNDSNYSFWSDITSPGFGLTDQSTLSVAQHAYEQSNSALNTANAAYALANTSEPSISRQFKYVVGTSIMPNTSISLEIDAGANTYVLQDIKTNDAMWIKIYTDDASRSSDSTRDMYTDPTGGSGVIAEVITSGSTTQKLSPGVMGHNDDTPQSNKIYISATNLSAAALTPNVGITFVPL